MLSRQGTKCSKVFQGVMLMSETRRKLSAIVDRDFYARFLRAKGTTPLENDSEFVRVLLDRALKEMGE